MKNVNFIVSLLTLCSSYYRTCGVITATPSCFQGTTAMAIRGGRNVSSSATCSHQGYKTKVTR